MISMTLRVIAPKEKHEEIVRIIHSLTGPTQIQPGCQACQAWQDLDDESGLILREEWKTQADLDRRIRSDEFKKVLAVMDLSAEPPEMKFDTVFSSMGFEYVKEILG